MAVKRPGRRRPAPVVGVAVAFLLLLTLATARPGDASLYPPAPADAVTVYLVDNGYHTDLALPRAALAGHRSGLAAGQASQRPWVLIGFGDARYFMDSGMSAGRALDGLGALLGMGHQAAIRFDGLPDAPDKVYAGGVRPIRISKADVCKVIRIGGQRGQFSGGIGDYILRCGPDRFAHRVNRYFNHLSPGIQRKIGRKRCEHIQYLLGGEWNRGEICSLIDR